MATPAPRRSWRLPLALCALLLAGCAPALLLPSSGQLMWALLKPLVGFDPNEVNLFEQPIVKQRMTALLGPNYDTTMKLLRTADELRREGPLFYVVSRYTPVPELAQKAGMVWNSDTNQLAVALLKGDAAEVFAEKVQAAAAGQMAQVEDAAQAQVAQAQEAVREQAQRSVESAVGGVLPVWPAAMDWANPRAAVERAVEGRVQDTVEAIQGQAAGALAAPPSAPRAEEPPAGDPAVQELYEAPDEADVEDEAPPAQPASPQPDTAPRETPANGPLEEQSAEELIWSTPEAQRAPAR